MRAREMKLSDYGIQEVEEQRLFTFCEKLDDSDRILLMQCAISAAPGLETFVYDSLVNRIGYDTICKYEHIPAKKDDFYGYRRKTLDLFYRMLYLTGIWR